MIHRQLTPVVLQRLKEFPAVALLGARQVGKTTLARTLTAAPGDTPPADYLDLENPADLEKLDDAAKRLAPPSGWRPLAHQKTSVHQ